MPTVVVKIGSQDVIASGTLCYRESDGPPSISIADLTFVLRFVSDDAKENSVTDEKLGDKTLALIFHNFNNPLGIMWVAEIGRIENRRLYLGFSTVQSGVVPDTSRSIDYSLSLGGSVDGE